MSKERKLYERKNIIDGTGYELPAVISEATTLRDQFAMAALPAIISKQEAYIVMQAATIAYSMADAMLKARSKTDD